MTTLKQPKDLLDFTDKVVVVTGASSGIGAGIARRFAAAGANVAVHYNRSAEAAAGVAAEISQLGGRALTVQADVASGDDVQRMFDHVISELSQIDIVINNAGIYPQTSLLEMTEADWDDTLDANLKGVFLCTQAAARHMVKRGGGGNIINISSIEAVNPARGHAHYTTSKAGVVMFTKTAALELGEHHIRVNAVGPGLINAPQLPTAWPDGLARWLDRVPLGRVGEPEDIADACLYLASDGARWVTGVHLLIDGGILTNQIF
jgi:NAD(P)-dependent dehydrogenase (short-subunit alcohol dehydrogenase family)